LPSAQVDFGHGASAHLEEENPAILLLAERAEQPLLRSA
jgi:hypothetical protein